MRAVQPCAWRSCLCTTALLGALILATSAGAQTVLETPQQANDRIRSLSANARMVPHDYLIGNGDLISIQVFDVPELSREVRVSQTGTVGIPLVPVRLYISGLTEIQAEQKITEVLEANGLVSHPQVSVAVKERKSKPITIVGAVTHPMVYEVDRPITLLEALAEAGGISNDAGDTVIVTRPEVPSASDSTEPPMIGAEDAKPPTTDRLPQPASAPATAKSTSAAPADNSGASKNVFPLPGTAPANPLPLDAASQNEPPPLSNTITVNLNDLLETGDAKNNVLLQAGDIITVPHAGIVYVLGAVTRPGGFVVGNDRLQLTTLKVLSLAGGLSRTAKTDHAVIIRKDSLGKQTEVAVDLKKVLKRETEDVQMRPSDILYVPDSGAKQVLLRAMEIGVAIGSAVAIFRVAYH